MLNLQNHKKSKEMLYTSIQQDVKSFKTHILDIMEIFSHRIKGNTLFSLYLHKIVGSSSSNNLIQQPSIIHKKCYDSKTIIINMATAFPDFEEIKVEGNSKVTLHAKIILVTQLAF